MALRALPELLTLEEIGQRVGCSAATAYRDVMWAMEKFAPDAEDTDRVRRQLYGQAVALYQASEAEALAGSLPHQDRCLKQLEFMAKLYAAFKQPEREVQPQTNVLVNLSFGTPEPEVIDQEPEQIGPGEDAA